MKCPIDNAQLVMTERHGVEIDYCPTCRGVWLDRGELDKIIDRADQPAAAPVALAEPARAAAPAATAQPAPRAARGDPAPHRDAPPPGEPRRYRDDDDDDDDRRQGRPRRRESFLSELFDF